MKAINEMSLLELAYHLEHHVHISRLELIGVIERLRELRDLTRWIPVDEALPNNGEAVLCRRVEGGMFGSKEIKPQVGTFRNGSFDCVFDWISVTHWRRIDKPEGV